MIAQFLVRPAKTTKIGSDYDHAVRRGLEPGSLYAVDHIKDYGWYQSVYLVGFRGGFNIEMFRMFEGDIDFGEEVKT